MDPYDRAHDLNDRALMDGEISPEEHRQEQRAIEEERQAEAAEAAENAYRNVMGGW
ncbi:MAG: hypothetical protein AAGK02_07165 [Pseudomonadota bacterium]